MTHELRALAMLRAMRAVPRQQERWAWMAFGPLGLFEMALWDYTYGPARGKKFCNPLTGR